MINEGEILFRANTKCAENVHTNGRQARIKRAVERENLLSICPFHCYPVRNVFELTEFNNFHSFLSSSGICLGFFNIFLRVFFWCGI